jgi:hypothetical protein
MRGILAVIANRIFAVVVMLSGLLTSTAVGMTIYQEHSLGALGSGPHRIQELLYINATALLAVAIFCMGVLLFRLPAESHRCCGRRASR